ncbi:carboxypeptidase regulatory-like domain-containing protein [Calditrichota bacterium]
MNKVSAILWLTGITILIMFLSCTEKPIESGHTNPLDPASSNSPPNAPFNPIPSNNASDIEIDAVLQWECEDPDNDDLTFEVYFGESNNRSLVASGLNSYFYSPSDLEPNKTYKWLIQAEDTKNNMTSGPEWSFSTGGGGSATISGLITDSLNGDAIGDALITSDNGASTQSDDEGAYSLELATGQRTITVSHDDYFTNFRTLTVTGGVDLENVDFTLSPVSATISGLITDSLSGDALEGVLLTSDDGASTRSDDEGEYSLGVEAGQRTITVSHECYSTNVRTLTVTEGMDLENVNFTLSPFSESISGLIKNSQSGDGMEGVLITSDNGTSTRSNEEGAYCLGVEAGERTITVSHDRYFTNVRTLTVTEGMVLENVHFTLSPTLGSENRIMRLILTWGQTPDDLDCHIRTPEIDGREFHVYWDSIGSLIEAPYVMLNLDDRSGEGPETITIYRFFSGTYRYYIDNLSQSVDITDSEALIEFYDSGGPLTTVNVPTTGTGRYWYVCDIDGDTGGIEIINQILEDEPEITNAIIAHPKY